MAWKAQRTILMVGEGYDEVAFLNHLKKLYVQRGCGLSVTVKNARGKGARHVIEWTARQIANIKYDVVAALLDTDVDWNAATEKMAGRNKIQVLKSEPCFEAMLLRMLSKPANDAAPVLKKRFAPLVNGDATQADNYATNFDDACLQAGRHKEPTIDALLKLLAP
ncbi:MAG: hypothetical protein QG652_1240 [Pseudomonadota bacterium]|nr:hypothetical protein [Pseudomonadota bacterium]